MRMRPSRIVKIAGGMIAVGLGICMISFMCGAKTSISIINGEVRVQGGLYDYMDNKSIKVESLSGPRVIAQIQEEIPAIKKIDISVETMDVNILAGDRYEVDLAYDESSDFSYDIKGDTLWIEQKDSLHVKSFNGVYDSRGVINIYIPQDKVLDNVDVSMGMGTNQMSDLKIKELELDCGMGKVEMSRLWVDEAFIEGGMGNMIAKELVSNQLEVSMGMGSVEIEGDLKGLVDIEGGMGELKLTTAGREEEYNLDISRGMGSISVNGQKYHTMEDVRVNNKASNNIIIEGGMGSITVNIKE